MQIGSSQRGVELVALSGQNLSDRQQPIALTADSDAGRFLQARTKMFRQHVTPWMRMRTCNVLRNTYARRAKLSDYICY